jgi:hypothetical protein
MSGKLWADGSLSVKNLDVVIIHAQMPAMAFERGFGEVVIEKGVVLEFGEIEFLGMEIERSLEHAEGFLFIEHSQRKEVADLEDEAASFLKQRRLRARDVPSKSDDLLLTGKMRPQIGNGFFRILGKLGERSSQLVRNLKPLVQHHVIDRQGKERVRLAAEVGDAGFDRSINDRIGVELVWDGFVVAFEKVLVER